MLNKIFGITLSVVLALASQAAFAQANVAQTVQVTEQSINAVRAALQAQNVASESVAAFVGGTTATLTATQVAQLAAGIIKVTQNSATSAEVSEAINSIVANSSAALQNQISSTIAKLGTTATSTTAALSAIVVAGDKNVSVTNEELNQVVKSYNIDPATAKSLSVDANDLQGNPVSEEAKEITVISKFNDVMTVAEAVSNPTAQQNAVQATVNYFNNTTVFATMIESGKNFMIDTINANPTVYGDVSNEITTANLLKYSDGQTPEAMTCLSTAAL